jgi:hypothetical protein
METNVKMVAGRFVVEISLEQVVESKADKFTFEVSRAQLAAAVKAAAPKPPVPGGPKPGPTPKTPETPAPKA